MQIFANMTLDDLKTGMIVTTRCGREYTVIRGRVRDELRDCDVFVNTNGKWRGFSYFDEYNNNLTAKICGDYDIVKVETCPHPFGFMDYNYRKEARNTIWKERHAVKLTVAEIESRLGYKIKIVSEEE